MSSSYKQYIGTFGLAKKLTAPCIVVHPYGGLGNTLNAIQGAIIAGTLLDKKVYVQWDRNQADIPNIEWHDLFESPEVFECCTNLFNGTELADNLIKTSSIHVNYFFWLIISPLKLLYLLTSLIPFPYLRRIFRRQLRYILHPDICTLSRWYGFDAYIYFPGKWFQNKKYLTIDFSVYKNKQRIYFESYYNIFDIHSDKPLPQHLGHYDFFKPTASLQKKIDVITRSFNDSTIGVHIRRTDQFRSIKYSPTTVFITAMHQAIALKPDTLFYLASDDVNEIKAMQAIFGTRIITQHNTVFNRYTKGGMHGAVIDLFCLSKTQRIIGSFKSSFGRVAAKVGRIEFKDCIVDQQ